MYHENGYYLVLFITKLCSIENIWNQKYEYIADQK